MQRASEYEVPCRPSDVVQVCYCFHRERIGILHGKVGMYKWQENLLRYSLGLCSYCIFPRLILGR